LRNPFPVFVTIALVSLLLSSCKPPVADSSSKQNPESGLADSSMAAEYALKDLKTDFSKHSVPIDSIHDGGPSKNGIPAIDFPEFLTVEQAKRFLTDVDYGILLQGKTETKFYPFNILSWHEIVNDEIGGIPVAVTFCPLCGTGIVYERIVKGDTLQFGVSGKLYESNLLMFDHKNESLWLQALGEAIAGTYTGEKLKLVNSSMVSYEDVHNHFSNALVLSPKTGFDRNYTQNPYGDYMSSDELYFPVSKTDARFSPKEMMYVVPAGKTAVAFHWKTLGKTGIANINTPAGHLSVKVENNVPVATLNNETVPGYFSFWFSWYAVYGDKGIVWGSR
jgi:hypothetical protein